MKTILFYSLIAMLAMSYISASAKDSANNIKILYHEVTVDAAIADVWQSWTTESGAKTFFAPECRIEAKVGGAYEMYFVPDAEPGSRGGEGLKILAFEPEKMLSFSWNAPPHLPNVRKQQTLVNIKFKAVSANQTCVELSQTGWGDGEEWDKTYAYFDRAWGKVVLPFLKYRFEHGPVDWQDPPRL